MAAGVEEGREVAPWPHQIRAVDEVEAAVARGERRVLVTSPTGMGKTRIMCELIDRWTGRGLKTVLYTNRKILVEQTTRVLSAHGIDHGTRAAGFKSDEDFSPVQVSSLMTEESRVYKRGLWRLHDADRALVDEAHNQTGKVARKVLGTHHAEGAPCVGFTATPIDLAGLYDCLIVAGTTSEGRECGALVPAHHFGPDEPDCKRIGRFPVGEDLTEKENVKAVMTPTIWARVFEWWQKLNPDQRPTILFGPGVGESVWFAEQFHAQGVSAAHIDGEDVWVNGEWHKASRVARAQVLADSKSGRVKVLCNRFVLREGVDAPWLEHMILATVFGSLQSYLQSGGRGLRACPGKTHLTVQDHGGNWHRHGSLNADRQWRLEQTAAMVTGLRQEFFRSHPQTEPCRCPRCARILTGKRCACGWQLAPGDKRSRPVVEVDGSLKEMRGEIYGPRRVSKKPDGPAIWRKMYYRSLTKKGQRTFRAAAALFAKENHWSWPDPSWPLMPKSAEDWFRLVKDVPPERLNP